MKEKLINDNVPLMKLKKKMLLILEADLHTSVNK